MEPSGLQRIIPIALVLIVVAAAIAGIVSIGQSLFSGEQQPTAVNVGKRDLKDDDLKAGVRMTIRGPIVGNEDHKSYSITVRPTSRDMTLYTGYNKKEVDSKQLRNNEHAYEQFVYALDLAAYMDGAPFTGSANDTRGICATGEVYTFELLQGTNTVQKLWTTSCKNFKGSFKANRPFVEKMFKQQIPNYDNLLAKIDMS
jgi:hypothetical protein